MNIIEKTLKFKHTKTIFLFGALSLFAKSVGQAAISIINELTLGSIMRNFLPTFPFLCLTILIFITDFNKLSLSTLRFERSSFKIKQILLIICIAISIVPLVSYAGSNVAMTNNIVIGIIIFAFLVSLFVSIKYDVYYGVIAFILTFPFLVFIQREFGFGEGFTAGPIVLNPVIIFLLILFCLSSIVHFTQKTGIGIPLYKTIGIYLFVFFISVVTSENIENSLKRYLLDCIYPVLYFFLIANNIKTDKQIKLVIYALIVSSVLYNFFDYYFILKETDEEIVPTYGIYSMGFGRDVYLLYSLPLAVSLAIISQKRTRLILVLACLIMGAFLLLHQSRIVFIAMVTSMAFFFRKKWIFITILFLSVMIIVFWNGLLHGVFSRFQEFTSIASLHPLNWSPMRYHAWIAAIDMIEDYPITGIGLGMWGDYYHKYGPFFVWNIPPCGPTRIWITSAHNGFFDVATATGIPGIVAWLLFHGIIFKESLSVYRNSLDETRKILALGCISSMWAFWIIWLGGGYPSFSADNSFGGGIAFWTMVSILFAIKRLELSKECKVV